MSRKIVLCWAGPLLLLGLFLAGDRAAAEVLTSSAQPGESCLAKAFEVRTSSLPTCGDCRGGCSSDPSCSGRKEGDYCSNDGGVCRTFSGCGVFNCCECANGFGAELAGLMASPPTPDR